MSHQLSIELEHLARRVLKTGWGGYGHVAHADYIDMPGGAFHVVLAVLSPYYQKADDDKRSLINEFIDKYRELSDKRVREKHEEVKKMTSELKNLIEELNG